MGCENSVDSAGVERCLRTGVDYLDGNQPLKAKEQFNNAIALRPELSQRVGISNSGGNPLSPTNGSVGPLPGVSMRIGDEDSEQQEMGHSGSAVFDKISQHRFHDAIETLKLRNRIGSIYFNSSQLIFAEEQFIVAQSGALSCRHSAGSPEQRTLSNQVWVTATLGVANVALVDAQQQEHHSARSHDRLCGFVLSQCSSMKKVIEKEDGSHSEDMALVLHLEAQAHLERKNLRQALFCAQRAAGIANVRFGVNSEERSKAQQLVQHLKEQQRASSANGQSGDVSEASLEDISGE